MQFALNDNGVRVMPNFSGQRAKCPLCGGIVIAKCGDVYIHHWQHHQDRECDPWKEHETEWHRLWKAKFPEKCQEVTIENNGEVHRADVRTPDGLIIEFQNSSISTTTITVREEFYEDMIWIVNAKAFKENFHLSSVVKTRLRELEEEAKYEATTYIGDYQGDLKAMDDEIKEKHQATNSKALQRSWKQNTVNKVIETHNALDEFAASIIGGWLNRGYYGESHISDIPDQVTYQLQEEVKSIPVKRQQLIAEQKGKKKLLDEIIKLEDIMIEDKTFKVIDYQRISAKSFHKVKAIAKESRRSFFPEIISFKTKYEFEQYKHWTDKFDFAFEPTNAIGVLEKRILEVQEELLKLEDNLAKLKEKIKNELRTLLEKKLSNLKSEVEAMDAEVRKLAETASYLEKRKEHAVYLREKDRDEYMMQAEKERTEKRSKIMKDKKGLYWFDWKRERKSWQVANAPLYFDIGKDYLFLMVTDKLFRKIMISDFLQGHLLTKPSEIK